MIEVLSDQNPFAWAGMITVFLTILTIVLVARDDVKQATMYTSGVIGMSFILMMVGFVFFGMFSLLLTYIIGPFFTPGDSDRVNDYGETYSESVAEVYDSDGDEITDIERHIIGLEPSGTETTLDEIAVVDHDHNIHRAYFVATGSEDNAVKSTVSIATEKDDADSVLINSKSQLVEFSTGQPLEEAEDAAGLIDAPEHERQPLTPSQGLTYGSVSAVALLLAWLLSAPAFKFAGRRSRKVSSKLESNV